MLLPPDDPRLPPAALPVLRLVLVVCLAPAPVPRVAAAAALAVALHVAAWAGQGGGELHSNITPSSLISDGPDIKLSSRVTSRLSLTRPRLMLMRTSNLGTEDR